MRPTFPAVIERMQKALTESPGATASALRRQVLEGGEVPADLAGYVEKVAKHAYRITDDDIAALKQAGHSEDAILEITYSAALGAGLTRMEAGLAALYPGKPGKGAR